MSNFGKELRTFKYIVDQLVRWDSILDSSLLLVNGIVYDENHHQWNVQSFNPITGEKQMLIRNACFDDSRRGTIDTGDFNIEEDISLRTFINCDTVVTYQIYPKPCFIIEPSFTFPYRVEISSPNWPINHPIPALKGSLTFSGNTGVPVSIVLAKVKNALIAPMEQPTKVKEYVSSTEEVHVQDPLKTETAVRKSEIQLDKIFNLVDNDIENTKQRMENNEVLIRKSDSELYQEEIEKSKEAAAESYNTLTELFNASKAVDGSDLPNIDDVEPTEVQSEEFVIEPVVISTSDVQVNDGDFPAPDNFEEAPNDTVVYELDDEQSEDDGFPHQVFNK